MPEASWRTRTRRVAALVACGLTLAAGGPGCAFGPQVLERSHWRYNESIRRVVEEQLLRNLVRLRYNEAPYQLNVSSIAAQYELAGGAEARPFFVAPNPGSNPFRTFTSVLPDVQVSGANRPTITMIPGDDGDTIRRFLTPISGDTLIFLAETSWPISTVLRLWAERINGVPNADTASGPPNEKLPDFDRFRRVMALMQDAQDREWLTIKPVEERSEVGGPLPASRVDAASAVEAVKNGLEYRPQGDGSFWSLTRKERRLVLDVNPNALGSPDLQELAGLLNLQPGRGRYAIVVNPDYVPDPLRFPHASRPELHITSRSTAQVYFFLANGVEVPCEHVTEGLVRPPTGPDGKPYDLREVTRGLFTVHAQAGHKPPPHAHVAIPFRGYWFYIDDRDQESKSTFSLMLSLSRLDFGLQKPGSGGPFLTLPVGR